MVSDIRSVKLQAKPLNKQASSPLQPERLSKLTTMKLITLFAALLAALLETSAFVVPTPDGTYVRTNVPGLLY